MLLTGDNDDACSVLRQLPQVDPVPRPSVTTDLRLVQAKQAIQALKHAGRARVYEADGWRCRYCGRLLVVPGVIELIGVLCPDEFPFPSHAMPRATTHPAAERAYPNVDHVHATSVGGTADEINLVTACTICNEKKGNRGGWQLLRPTPGDWDGLKSAYRELGTLAGGPRSKFHQPWLRALGV
jgi:HNH endonuclease